MLWQLQRAWFEREGADAFGTGPVPHYVTNNPAIAGAYARVIVGWLRDQVAAGAIDPSEPLYVVELGAGTGRFAWQFLGRLRKLLASARLPPLRVIYVLTDLSERTLEWWRAHPKLRPLFESGDLELARFDAANDERILVRGAPLAPKNPLAVIANYVFDGIPHDAFEMRDRLLHECRAALSVPEPEDPANPGLLERAKLDWELQPVNSHHYGDPDFDGLLAWYAANLPDGAISFPVAGLRCLRRLEAIGGGRLFVLSADKGYVLMEDVVERRRPQLASHGCISLMVNFDAIQRFTSARGGEALGAERRSASVQIVALSLGGPPLRDTRLAFNESIAWTGPDDIYLVKKALEGHYEDLPLEPMLALLRLSGSDSQIAFGMLPWLQARAVEAGRDAWPDVVVALARVRETYFYIGESSDLPFQMGVLLQELERPAEALVCFNESLAWFGPDAATLHNTALCHYALGDNVGALAWCDRALAHDGKFDPARRLRAEVERARSA
jgi:SAM-dependent methyltransferase